MLPNTGPLQGIRVVDLSQFMAGPLAAQRLGDYGADVIKIEAPKQGDRSRLGSASMHTIAGERVGFFAFNRNKRSLSLNLKHPKALEICIRLIRTADVLIENFRPGVMDRLGLGYPAMSALNARLIYGSVTGYGACGPYQHFPGQDLLVQCLSGMVYLNGRAGDPPTAVGTPIIDAASGQQLTAGILAALVNRGHTGHGQHVEVSLLDTAIDLQAQEFTTYLNCNVEPHRSASGIAHPHFVPPYGIYATKDGYMALAHTPINRLVEFFGLPSRLNELASGAEVFEHRDEIFALLSSVICSRTTREWLDDLRAHDFWCGPVHSYRELADDPQVHLNEMIIGVPYKDKQTARVIGIPVKFSDTPGSIRRTPPEIGQHTAEILTELGVSPDEIDSLRTEHAV